MWLLPALDQAPLNITTPTVLSLSLTDTAEDEVRTQIAELDEVEATDAARDYIQERHT